LFVKHEALFKQVLNEYLSWVTHKEDRDRIKYWCNNWAYVREIVRKARDTRNAMFHKGEYDGLLRGTDRFDKLMEFNSLVTLLLVGALLLPASIFDRDAKKSKLLPNPKRDVIIPFRSTSDSGVLSYQEFKTGKRVTNRTDVQSVRIDDKFKSVTFELPKEGLWFGGSSSSFAAARPVIDGLYSLELADCKVRGVPRFDEDFEVYLDVHEWTSL